MRSDISPTHSINRESIRAAIQKMLKEPVIIQDEDNLISLGLDSLKIMRLANLWRKAGVSINFATLLESPTLGQWAALLADTAAPATSVGSESVPCNAPVMNEPFALTDVQHAYWIGRRDSQVLGGVGCHAYIEIDGSKIDPEKLRNAWNIVQMAHPMLRARFRDDGMQEIMDTPVSDNYTVTDIRHLSSNDVEAYLESTRNSLSHYRFEIERGEVAAIELSLLPEGKTRLHFHIDLLVADVHSLHIVLQDIAEAYQSGSLPEGKAQWNFNAYLAEQQVRNADALAKAATYWAARVPELPEPPSLPMITDCSTVRNHTFKRRTSRLSSEAWACFKAHAASYGLTPAIALLTLYSEVLAHWSSNPHFLVSLPLFDRQFDVEGIEQVVADFTNLLVVEADCTEKTTFLERARQIQQRFNKDVAHSAYSGVRVQRDLARKREGRALCAPAVFAYNADAPLVSAKCREVFGELQYMISQTPQVWLDLQIYETEAGMLFAWDAVDQLFPETMLDSMVSAFSDTVHALAENTEQWGAPCSPRIAHGEPAREDALHIVPATLHSSIFDVAEAFPKKVALINPRTGEERTYEDLVEKALQISRLLKASGLVKGNSVAITLPRGEEQIIAALGILAAGGVYVPVSPEMPYSRRQRIHARAEVKFVVTSEELERDGQWPEGTVCVVPTCADELEVTCDIICNDPQAPAYIIFTSGSTGEPKGVCLRHNAARATIDAVNTLYNVGDADRAICVSALDFDLSVYDIFGLLGRGGSLVLVDEEARRDAELWGKWISEYGVTLWNSVPLLLEMVLPFIDNESHVQLRLALLSGDRIASTLPKAVWEVIPACQIIGMGGATEGAIWSNHIDIPREIPTDWLSIPYGRPLPGQAYRVVDFRGNDCPPWKAGELWIGGSGVADGYAGDTERTEEQFVEYKGERWYRTGDRGCFWPDGTIAFLGREDLQVKIRGHRIELGEIETALRRSDMVIEAVVTVATEGVRPFLVGHVVPAAFNADEELLVKELLAHLRDCVPEYMLPSRWSFLEKFPLTANGKVDRKALHVPASKESASEVGYAPMESELAIIWKEVLGQSVDRHGNFFSLGGDSLLATRLIAKIRQTLAPELPLDALFQTPTVAGLAQHSAFNVNKEDKSETVVKLVADPANRFEPFPLTDVQYTYWIGRTGAYALGNVATHVFFEFDSKPIELGKLQNAWRKLVARHDMLRTVFLPDATQLVLEHAPDAAFTITDLREAPEREVGEFLASQRALMERQVLPETTGPLYDIHIVRHTTPVGERLRIFFDIDALIADAWSVFLLIDEWFLFYDNPEHQLPVQEIAFRDYVMMEQKKAEREAYKIDRDYWFSRAPHLPAAPVLPVKTLPDAFSAENFIRKNKVLSKSVWSNLKEKIQEAGLTASGFLIAAYAEVLARWSRTPHFTLNITLFNRPPLHKQVENIVGDFTSLLLLEVDLRKAETALERARAVQAQLWRDMDHRLVSGVEVLREMTQLAGGRTITMPVVFTGAAGLGGSGRDASSLGRLGTLVSGLAQTPQVWLDHQTYEQNGALNINWDAVEGLFPEGMLEEMFDAYTGYLTRLSSDAEAWNKAPSIALPAQQEAVRQAVNDTAQSIPTAKLHELFAHQAVKTPDAPAVITSEKTVSYRELLTRADRVAETLRSRAIGAGHMVAVTIDKCWEQIASVLGVLATGAAYIPFDPSLPDERVATILEDSGASIVLICSEIPLNTCIPYLDVRSLFNEPFSEAETPFISSWTGCSADGDSLAYVIYTSGSTGRPKGVMTGHQGAVNTVLDMNERFNVTASDRVFGLSALTFDLSVYDIFGPLAVGGAVVLPDADHLRNPDHWHEMMIRHSVTVWNSVPALMQMFVSTLGFHKTKFPESFRLALLSGDWIPLDLPDTIKTLGNVNPVSLGGATEASIWSIYHEIEEKKTEWSSIPYGRPLGNQTMHVFNDALEDCPDWVTGHIHIGGTGLAKGYWNDAEKTAAAFIQHPLTGERLYRTGDMGRYHPSGDIEFLGREDTQVKVGGFRIELGEVEAALGGSSAVREATVLVGTNEKLIGFVVPHPDVSFEKAVQSAQERAAQLLPEYMIPAVVIAVSDLPLTANGKVDRKELAQRAQVEEPEPAAFTPPQSDTEQFIADIWNELLEIERVDVNAHFFEVGGNSLLAVQVINRLRSRTPELSVVTLFEYPTVASLAQIMDSFEPCSMQKASGMTENTFPESSRAALRKSRNRQKISSRRR